MKSTSEIVNGCIEEFLKEYIISPLLYLRESSAQSRLRELIHQALDKKTCHAQVMDANKDDGPAYGRGEVARTQEEMKVPNEKNSRTDIIVFREATEKNPITLSRERNGALDIIARTKSVDIDAAIEIKAACSADKSQRALFVQDLIKLLSIKDAPPKISRHFVLIDKSVCLGGVDTIKNKDPITEWWNQEPNSAESEIKVNESAPGNKPFVHVWTIEAPDNNVSIKHRYCTHS